ncbi:MAG: glycosyltransferase [Bacilli bacterium]|nr:glycosyltransferase [Bacilli bacterium]
MLITFVCDVLGKENNGTTIATMNVIRAMQQKGHTVRIVCPDEDKAGLTGYFVLPRIHFGIFDNYVHHNGVTLAKKDIEILTEAIKGADVVHCNLCGSASVAAVEIAHKMGIPVTASLHSQAENFTSHVKMQNWEFANKTIYKVIYNRLFSKVDAVHYPTQFIRDDFEERVGVRTNGYVISNGVRSDFRKVEVQKPEKYRDKLVILYSARLGPEKDHKTLINGIKRSKYRNKIQLILCGTGPLKKKVRKWAKGLANPVDIGFHSHEEMIQIINYSDLYVHSSVIDLEAISALEAIACGLTPVLSDSKQAAIRYFALEPNNLFKHKNPRDLAKKIDYWIEHPEEKKANSKKYLGFSRRFDFDLAMDSMEKMFSDTAKYFHYDNTENFMETVLDEEK